MNILILITDVRFSTKYTSLDTSSFDMSVKLWVDESENVSYGLVRRNRLAFELLEFFMEDILVP